MNGGKKSLILKKTAVTGAILAAMAAPLIVMPSHASADLASAVESGSYGPVVTIVSPQYADVVKGNSVSIEVAVQQRSNPVKALQMFVDDHIATPGWVPLKSLQSSRFNWDTTLFKNGPHKLTVRVADAAGLIGQAEITIYVNNGSQSQQQDVSAPALQWLGIENGKVLKGVVNLELQASANFGVKYIFVMLNSVNDPDKKPALRSWMINQPPYIIPFDTTKVNDGAYVLDALAYDALSNQGEAPRLNIGIANNTINPTYFSPPTTELVDDSTSGAQNTQTPTNADTSNSEAAADDKATDTPATNSANSTNTKIASTQTAPLVVPFQPAAPTLIPQQPRNGALNSNNINNYNNDDNSGSDNLTVETVASAHVQRPVPDAQPRVTPLPMRTASNEVPVPAPVATAVAPKTTIAQPTFFASTNDTPTTSEVHQSNDQPLTTMASTKVSSLPMATKSDVLSQSTETAVPVREAKLPSLPLPSDGAMAKTLRQSSPLSTIVNTQAPNSLLAQVTQAQNAPQRYFQVNDALSIPLNSAKEVPAKAAEPAIPVFPSATLNSRSAKGETPTQKSTFTAPTVGIANTPILSRMVQSVPGNQHSATLVADAKIGSLQVEPSIDKSTFTAPSAGMTDVKVSSRMVQAIPASPTSARSLDNVQISSLPGHAVPKPAVVSSIPSQPLFTAPDATTTASSRIASANITGVSWGYQRNAQSESGQSTKPQIAFLPNFNSKTKVKDSLASITVSPASARLQVNEMSQSWPAIYQARHREQLSEIAERYGLPVEVLAKNNNLKNGAILTAGQEIKMPRNLQVTYNGKALKTDVSSMLVGSTSVAAFRFLFEQQGGTVTWDSANRTVHAKNGDKEISLTIGSDQAVVNQKTVMMDMAAFLLSGRTMVPVRFFETSMNAHVTWDPATGRMFMAMAG